MTVVEPITSSNSTTGAGVIDSWHSLASSIEQIKTAHGADAAAIGVEIGVTVVGAVADTVAFALDPLAKLISAGLGWLIEHISFLKWPLDQVAGNPAEIKKLADELHKIAETLRRAAKDMDSALQAQVTHWKGAGYDSFKKEIDTRRTQIDDSGHSVDIAGYVVETTMALITATRSLIRDLITTVLGDIISAVLIGLALAPLTFGASLVVAVGTSVGLAAAQAVSFAAKLAKLAGLGGRTVKRLEELAAKIRPTTSSGSSHEMTPIPPHTGSSDTPVHQPPASNSGSATPSGSGTPHVQTPPGTPHEQTPSPSTHDQTPPGTPHEDNEPFDTWLAADQHFNGPHDGTPSGTGTLHEQTPPPSTHDQTPPGTPHEQTPSPSTHDQTPPGTPHDQTPPPSTHENNGTEASGVGADSYLKPKEIAAMKKHETWLETNAKDGWQKVKFVDDFVRTDPKLKEYYPAFKAFADAKSSKNWVGWVGKDIVNVDKALTDIQMQADAAWAESGARWRQAHPDPAAHDPNAQQKA
jgi:hypothetical protein